MIRTILGFAVALLAWEPLFVTPAAACISCEYTPEVVNTPHPKDRKRARKAPGTLAKERPARKRMPPREIAVPKDVPAKEARSTDVVSKEAAPADVAPASVAKDEAPVGTSTASKKPSAAPADPSDDRTDARPNMQASTDTPAPSGTPQKPIEQAKAPEELGCKKFIPTAGITVSVPCE